MRGSQCGSSLEANPRAILPKDFETRFVNGKSLADWIRSAQE
jgi:hypothetical protein